MLRLKISPNEFAAMIFFMRHATEGHRQIPLQNQSVKMLVMAQYLAKWNPYKFMLWTSRSEKKSYWLSLPLPVAMSLHQDMQKSVLLEFQQLFLNKLDQAIISYRDPFTQAHVTGPLISR